MNHSIDELTSAPSDTAENAHIYALDPLIELDAYARTTSLAFPGEIAPLAGNHLLYQSKHSSKGTLTIGIWEGETGRLRIAEYPHDEFCVVILGELVVTSNDGSSQTYKKGNTFVIPKGFSGTWDMRTTFRKLYAIATG